MHEMAVVQALLDEVRRYIPEGAVLRQVKIDVGGLEHLDDRVMQTAWSALTADTDVAGSTLSVSYLPLRVRCLGCRHVHEPQDTAVLLCPKCGAARPQVLQGTGLRSLEVDEPAELEAL
ncbi:MAG: hydrogenase maturation nickel metallochaperone HypA/HybF [Planctomycetota bacterium]|jgi:Zn finger protein HypA/HybF involved in hydrogenase expression